MKIKTYNAITLTPICTFSFILIILQNEWLSGLFVLPQSVLLPINILKSAIALFTFFSGIYFFQTNISKEKKITKPIWLIFMGGLFIILSYGPVIISYKMINGLSVSTLKSEHIQKLKAIAVDGERPINDRISSASMVFVDTGEKVRVLGGDEKITIFKPSSKEISKRQSKIETNQSHQFLRTFIKKAFIYQIFLLFIFLCSFIILMKRIPPKLMIFKE